MVGDRSGAVRAGEDVASQRNGSRGHHAGYGAEPPGVADAAGFHDRAGIVDDRRGRPRDQARGSLQRGFAEVGIADGVEDQLMRRQRQLWVEIVGNNHGCQKDAVVQERSGRDIAAARGDQLQQRDRRLGPAIRQGRNGVVAKALLEMMPRAGAVAEIREHGAQSLMRLGVFRIDPQAPPRNARALLRAGWREAAGWRG